MVWITDFPVEDYFLKGPGLAAGFFQNEKLR